MQHLYGRTYLTSPRGQLGDYTYVGPLIQLPPRAYKKSTLRVTYMLPACKQHFGADEGVARGCGRVGYRPREGGSEEERQAWGCSWVVD